MNFRAIIKYSGYALGAGAVFMLVPLFLSVAEREYHVARAFAETIGVMLAVTVLCGLIKRGHQTISAKDGFVLVAVCWILLSFFGSLPFWFSGEIPSYIDSLFEAVSGFTATGATVLSEVESLNKGLLFWRCFMHWIGGMGVLVFLLAIIPSATGENPINVMKAEATGPSVGKFVPHLRQSAKILYSIYIGMTAIQTILYLCGGMPVFDAVCISLSTAGTGGFAVRNESLAYYNSAYIETVTIIFMILFGVNFNIYYLLLVKKFKAAWRSEELRVYLGIIVVSIAIIGLNIYHSAYSAINSAGVALRQAAFHVASIMTTTGFTITDYHDWSQSGMIVLLLLTFVGGCGGSTSGGLKVSRIVIMFKETRRFLFRMSHPHAYEAIKMDGKPLDKTVVHGVSAYLLTFSLIFVASLLLLSFNNCDFITTFSAVAATLNNVGPGFGLVDPMGNYGFFSTFSKSVLIFNMLVGRLEIYPMLILLSPHAWRKL